MPLVIVARYAVSRQSLYSLTMSARNRALPPCFGSDFTSAAALSASPYPGEGSPESAARRYSTIASIFAR